MTSISAICCVVQTINPCSCWFPGYLDIPPVNVTAVEDDKVQFRFIHPWVFYHQNLLTRSKSKPQKKKRHDALTSENLPLFLYEVKIFNQVRLHSFTSPPKVFCDVDKSMTAVKMSCRYVSISSSSYYIIPLTGR